MDECLLQRTTRKEWNCRLPSYHSQLRWPFLHLLSALASLLQLIAESMCYLRGNFAIQRREARMRQRCRWLSSPGTDLVKDGSSGVRQFMKWLLYVCNGKSFNSISKRFLPAGFGRRGTADQVVGLLFARKGEKSSSDHTLSAWSVWGQVCWRSEDLLPCVGAFFFRSHISNNYFGVYWS